MLKRRLKLKKILWCHRAAHLGLSGGHVWAAVATGKPEVYLPLAGLYLALAVME